MPYDPGGGSTRKTPQTRKPTGGPYPAHGYNYSYGTRTPFDPNTYTRAPGIGALPPMGGPPAGRGGSRSGGGGSSRYGGGGGRGGYVDYAAQQRAELEQRKAALIAQLTGTRDAARPMLENYANQYDANIASIFGQNQGLTQGYTNQLSALMQQMANGTRTAQQTLSRDFAGQGLEGAGPEMRAMSAMADQNVLGQQFRQQNADAYNQRLAQMMAAAQADAQAMGQTIRASSQGNLENSYAQLLAQIGMMGLV